MQSCSKLESHPTISQLPHRCRCKLRHKVPWHDVGRRRHQRWVGSGLLRAYPLNARYCNGSLVQMQSTMSKGAAHHLNCCVALLNCRGEHAVGQGLGRRGLQGQVQVSVPSHRVLRNGGEASAAGCTSMLPEGHGHVAINYLAQLPSPCMRPPCPATERRHNISANKAGSDHL